MQSLVITDTDLSNELTESYKVVSVVKRLEFKLKIFMERKSDEEATRTESSNRPGVKLSKFELKRFSGDLLNGRHLKRRSEQLLNITGI